MMGPCPNCDTRTRLTGVGLCRRCRDELRFVVRPVAHREMYRRGLVEMCDIHAAMERVGVAIISSLPDDNGLWICDLCNVEIPVTGEHTLIPLLGSYALCIPCASSFPYWPDGWTQPTPRACRCGACQRPVLSALARIS
jgi:hypothetical protein